MSASRWFCATLMLLCANPLSVTAQSSKVAPLVPLQFDIWSGDINVPDPVAISVDHKGQVYITQTQRRKIQDLDIRANRDWIPNDVGLKSVEDKRQFFRQQMAIGGDDEQQSKRVADHNGDGHHDWRDLTVVSEKIYKLVDTNDDGKADTITTFAENFQTEVTGIAAGVLALDDSVWATIAPDVWRMVDRDQDGIADEREVMATGFGLHIAYAGHDMHGLIRGPDGKIYWSIGDKGISVKTADGRSFQYPNQGGVMRCNPDGSDFEVFAHGLRNVQEVAFDQYGNMFGVDNDADFPGERERFCAIVNQMDAGWRCNYQYRGSGYNPWTAERLHLLPEGTEHPAYIIPPIRHYIDGPAGFAFNPGTAIDPQYKDYFFIAGAPNGNQHAFRVEPTGDTFKMVDEHKIGKGYAIVGLTFAPDGGLYGADWDGGYPLDQKGSVIRIDGDSEAGASVRAEVKRILGEGFAQLSTERLVELLSHPDMRVRMGAQFRLVDLQETSIFAQILGSDDNDVFALLHSVWGLGQLARGGDETAATALKQGRQANDSNVRAQFAKTFGELRQADGNYIIPLLNDKDLHVQVMAGLALGRQPTAAAVPILFAAADRLETNQYYLRHALVTALAACAKPAALQQERDAASDSRRLVCALALRRQGSPMVAAYLTDSTAAVANAAARAIHDDDSIEDALVDLASMKLDTKIHGEPLVRRWTNANFRLGSKEAANRVLELAADENWPTNLRVDACEALAAWNSPEPLDRVDGRARGIQNQESRAILSADDVGSKLVEIIDGSSSAVRIAAVITARKIGVSLPVQALQALLADPKGPPALRAEALDTLAGKDLPDFDETLRMLTASQEPDLAIRAINLLAVKNPELLISTATNQINEDQPLVVKQAWVQAVAAIESAGADLFLTNIGKQLADRKLKRGLELDVLTAIEQRSEQTDSSWDSLLSQIQKAQPRRFADAPKAVRFTYALDGGDRDRGKKLFETHLQSQCSRCHKIGKTGSDIGPDLSKIAKTRDAEHLLRALVQPSVDIEKKYMTQMVLLDDGQILKGAIKSEDDDQMILIDSTGKELKVDQDQIEEVIEQKISLMPEMTDVLTPHEVRDLVAYLRTLKK
ncbi:Cytochrome c [Roseimaritima multifibrata]|uniref:Cytochrome c n=1 Tax=Roseimaritima multifibrata TaxID=1930274 RepID=A0A517MFJ0_9BACT|nr:c-type cytochrome [Roseimaritima multifibrata]QDS93659.1 Cytochrome c [Roseimaritima multifibrata]